MATLERVAVAVGKFAPAFGWIANRMRFPGLHCGVQVEILGRAVDYGVGTRIGALSRIYLHGEGRLTLGDAAGLGRDVHIETRGRVVIGAGTGLNDGARVNGDVAIGRGCAIGPYFIASSGFHQFRSAEPWLPIIEQDTRFPAADRPVVIHDDCWIGAHVAVMPGVTIGRGAVIGANAVVTRDVPPYTIVAGVPARAMGERLRFEPPASIDAARPEHRPYFYSGLADPDRANGGYPCDAAFTLALGPANERPGSIALFLEADEPGVIEHRGQSVTIAAGASEARFMVAASDPQFRAFTATAPCRLLRAVILTP